MKRHFLSLIITALSLFASAETTSMKVRPFQHLKVSSSFNVDCIHCPDSVGYVLVNAPNSAQTPWVEADSNGTKLAL